MDTIHDFLHSVINHLIPHEGNDYRPHLLQRGAMILMLILILLSFLAANFQALLWQSSDWLVGAVLPAVVVDLTNAKRADLALPVLTRNKVLDAAATLKAEDMAKNSYFSHDSPTGVTPWHWFSEAGYPFVQAGENLAVYFTDSGEVVEAWMNSPTHRANIVGSQFREIGVGTAKGTYKGFETVFVVQLFGTLALAPTPVVPPSPRLVPARPVATLPVPVADTPPLAVATERPTVVERATVTPPLVAGEMTDVPDTTPPPLPTNTAALGRARANDRAVAPEMPSTAIVENSVSTDTESTPVEIIAVETKTKLDARQALGIYSDLAASSTNLTPAPYTTADTVLGAQPNKIAVLATEPSKLLQLLYLVLGGITALVLLLSVLLEWRHHRPLQTAYGLGLLLLMAGLFYIHTTLTLGAVIL